MLYKSVVALCIAGASAFSGDALLAKFEAWKKQHGKSYSTADALTKAMSAFASNDEVINTHNAKNLSYTLGHNKFSDLTWPEFQEAHMSRIFTNKVPKNMDRVHIRTDVPLASSVDWVAKGAVTPVKDQQRCGSCWAFSTTGSVEGAYQIASGDLVSLSEENLVQCDHNGDQGCQGGLMDNAFEWIQSNGGICSEEAYPYTSGTGTTGTCKKGCSPVVTVGGHRDVPSNDESALKSAVSSQPVSIAIEADKSAFQLYKSGVLDSSSCGTKLDHGVLLVGYGTDSSSGKDFWKVKNSWGATWGEEGYIRMVRGKNMCGLAQQPSYPTGAKAVGPSPPSPGPSPSPPSPTPPAAKTHYSDPTGGCMTDESEITIQGVSGDFCSPKCTGFFKMHCPSDVPAGVTAEPQCALQDSATNEKYCALICSATNEIKDQKAADAQCGKGATCKPIQGLGICTYDD